VTADAQAVRVLVKGEPLSAPAGRADDFAWPRREIGHAKSGTLAASASLESNAPAPAAPLKPKKARR